jgi:hypothetical protein
MLLITLMRRIYRSELTRLKSAVPARFIGQHIWQCFDCEEWNRSKLDVFTETVRCTRCLSKWDILVQVGQFKRWVRAPRGASGQRLGPGIRPGLRELVSVDDDYAELLKYLEVRPDRDRVRVRSREMAQVRVSRQSREKELAIMEYWIRQQQAGSKDGGVPAPAGG